MMQCSGMLMQFPVSRPTVPTTLVSPPQPQNKELFLAVEETDFDEKMNDVRKKSTKIIGIRKSSTDFDKKMTMTQTTMTPTMQMIRKVMNLNKKPCESYVNKDKPNAGAFTLHLQSKDLPNSPPLSRVVEQKS